jgi:hypothetical protein
MKYSGSLKRTNRPPPDPSRRKRCPAGLLPADDEIGAQSWKDREHAALQIRTLGVQYDKPIRNPNGNKQRLNGLNYESRVVRNCQLAQSLARGFGAGRFETLITTQSAMELKLASSIIRPWSANDAVALQRQANNHKIWLNLRDVFPHPYTIENAHGVLRLRYEGRSTHDLRNRDRSGSYRLHRTADWS